MVLLQLYRPYDRDTTHSWVSRTVTLCLHMACGAAHMLSAQQVHGAYRLLSWMLLLAVGQRRQARAAPVQSWSSN